MNLDRIGSSISTDRMAAASWVIVGGAYGLAADLARSGARKFTLMDFDLADENNPQRQDISAADAANRVYKTHACAGMLRSINPDVDVATIEEDICAIDLDRARTLFADASLFIFATDSFAAQARGNLLALGLGVPAVWIGMYPQGRAGEIIFWRPGLPCYRCNASSRYHAAGRLPHVRTSSQGGTIFDLRLVDAVAGYIAVGLVTRGMENRFGQLIDQLGNRNLLQIKIDPNYTLNGKDIFARYLGEHAANFSFTTIALPMEPEPGCPDCGGRGGA